MQLDREGIDESSKMTTVNLETHFREHGLSARAYQKMQNDIDHGCPHPPSSVPELFCPNGCHLTPMETSITKTYSNQKNRFDIHCVCIILAIF